MLSLMIVTACIKRVALPYPRSASTTTMLPHALLGSALYLLHRFGATPPPPMPALLPIRPGWVQNWCRTRQRDYANPGIGLRQYTETGRTLVGEPPKPPLPDPSLFPARSCLPRSGERSCPSHSPWAKLRVPRRSLFSVSVWIGLVPLPG